MKKVYIVDSDESFLKSVSTRLDGEGIPFEVFQKANDALKKVAVETPAVIIIDYNLSDRDSKEVLREILRLSPFSRVIMVASGVVEDPASEILSAGAAEYFVKPVNLNKLITTVKNQINRYEILIKSSAQSAKWWRKALAFIGIHFPGGKNDVLHVGKRLYYTIGIAFIVVLIGSVAFIEYSMSPSFCASCHIMKPYYDMWKTSQHKSVACVDCHYPPGFREQLKGKFQAVSQVAKFITGTYSTKPYAEIEDASCLRQGCHSTRLLRGKVLFKKGIVFDHTPHLTQIRGGIKLRCTSCHSQIVQGSHMSVTETTCFICHFNGLEKDPTLWDKQARCTICHEIPSEDIEFENITYNHQDFAGRGVSCQKCHLEVIKGEGEVPKEFCVICHGEQERLDKYDDFPFLHKKHVTDRKVECTRCHTEIKHSVTTSVKPLDYSCKICHEKKHSGHKELYMGVNGRGVENMPSPMFIAQVDCIGCHVVKKGAGKNGSEINGSTLEPSEVGCLNCHGDDYKGMLDEWKDSVNMALKEVRRTLETLRPYMKRASAQAKHFFDDAEYNIEFVEYSKGVHNVDYALALLDKSKEYLMEAKKLIF